MVATAELTENSSINLRVLTDDRKTIGRGGVYTPPFVVLSGITSVILHKEIMLPIQVVTGDLQSFPEPLEVDDLTFPQEAQRSEDFGVIGHVDEVFVGGAGFLFCCTFVSVMCYVK